MVTLPTLPSTVRTECSACQFQPVCRPERPKAAPAPRSAEDKTTPDFTYISFGAGVQSTALLVMSNLGLHGCPRADVAIFADTQGEPQWVYDHLSYMERWSAIPIIRVTAGNLAAALKARIRGKRRRAASIPGWTKGQNGRSVPLWRQCTRDYKITPILQKVRALLGYGPRQAVRRCVRCLLGISRDEVSRMRPSRVNWCTNLYPLVDAGMDRADCVGLLRQHRIPVPRRSACVFCPYHSDAFWRDLRENHPLEWRRAVAMDHAVRDMSIAGIRSPVYLHRSCLPLELATLPGENPGTADHFENDCEGLCGV
jgi:hypothetical protein